ncbi:ABC transporter substrate-binding protein [Bifidobacterium dolichotidis]|uniref:ABC transporter substrate-binding protein n=1 Tax=Bifidobacterium dolichotidis TaxID=2306976 RepID=A0A430FTF1_9BIFI|nr:transporter substrate-binding domain-containing protein [Bifidobacterium dolichotidis]RSX56107.1 ABC transporter substrate-binding protein [Bifidobacterium dolichotidis]
MQHNHTTTRHALRRAAAALTCLLTVGAASACGTSVKVMPQGQPDGPVLTIGVPAREPALSVLKQGEYSGFDVDVARYVAQVLGYGSSQITFRTVTPITADTMLENGDIALAVGIQAADSDEVSLSDSYLTVPNTFMVLDQGADTIRSTKQLEGSTVCAVEGTHDADSVEQAVSDVAVREESSYQKCVSALMSGAVQAVTGNEAIMRGLAQQAGTQYVAIMPDTYGSVGLKIGTPSSKPELVEMLNSAIKQMIQDGQWTAMTDQLQHNLPGLNDGKALPKPTNK